MRRTHALLAASLWLAGCGSWAAHRPGRDGSARVAQAQATHEYPSRPPAGQHAAGGGATAMAAVAAFASAYINWDAETVSRDMRALATRSIGQARATTELAAAQTASDYELQRGGIANRGSIEAVAPLRGAHDQYVVVTRELTTATASTAYQGLQPAWHVAIAAVVQQRPGQWVVSGWQPES